MQAKEKKDHLAMQARRPSRATAKNKGALPVMPEICVMVCNLFVIYAGIGTNSAQ
jgi:hypothetical protein